MHNDYFVWRGWVILKRCLSDLNLRNIKAMRISEKSEEEEEEKSFTC